MKAYVIAATALLAVATVKADDAADLLQAKLDLAVAQQSFGANSPRIPALHGRIDALEKLGTVVDIPEASRQLTRMALEREQLIKARGRKSPEVILLTRQIAALASLLADAR